MAKRVEESPFADFMTAMMAFFLVLWIINATDKKTQVIIARYFNPLKLEDMSKANKGIRQLLQAKRRRRPPKADTEEGDVDDPSEKKKTAVRDRATIPTRKSRRRPRTKRRTRTSEGADRGASEAHISEAAALLGDPYASLDQIAGKVAVGRERRKGASKVASSRRGGDARRRKPCRSTPTLFVDPFKPVERAPPATRCARQQRHATVAARAAAASRRPAARNGVQTPPSPAPACSQIRPRRRRPPTASQAPHPAPDGRATAPVAPGPSPGRDLRRGAQRLGRLRSAARGGPPSAPAPAAPRPRALRPSPQPPPPPADAGHASWRRRRGGSSCKPSSPRSFQRRTARPGRAGRRGQGDARGHPHQPDRRAYNFSMFAVGSVEPQAR